MTASEHELMPAELTIALIAHRWHPSMVESWRTTESGYEVRLKPDAALVEIEFVRALDEDDD
jgi:hypothetical protein